MEIWKDVIGYEGKYEVSNTGKVRSLHFSRGNEVKELKLTNDKNGYKAVSLWNDGKQSTGKVHRLVAQAFLPNPYNYPQINHKDENVANNHVDNLEWCTCEYNINYGNHNRNNALAQTGKKHTLEHIMKIRANAPTSKPVCMLDPDTLEIVKEYPSASEAARQMNGIPTNISSACRKKRIKSKGYYWRYKEDM